MPFTLLDAQGIFHHLTEHQYTYKHIYAVNKINLSVTAEMHF